MRITQFRERDSRIVAHARVEAEQAVILLEVPSNRNLKTQCANARYVDTRRRARDEVLRYLDPALFGSGLG
jgi:hypothetical protein